MLRSTPGKHSSQENVYISSDPPQLPMMVSVISAFVASLALLATVVTRHLFICGRVTAGTVEMTLP